MKVKVNNKIAKYQLTGDTRDTCYFKIMHFAIEWIYKKYYLKCLKV